MDRSGNVVWWEWRRAASELPELLAAGGVVAFPTESSYGLGVDPENAGAVETVYALKGRPRGMPLPVVVADTMRLAGLGMRIRKDSYADTLAGAWPAPLSLVLPVERPLPAAAGGGSLAVRVPAHAELRELLARTGAAMTATSANRSGEPPCLDPEAVAALLKTAPGPAAVVDGGPLEGGPPSTLVEPGADGVRVLRWGAFERDRLAGLVGREALDADGFSADSVEISVEGGG